MVAERGKICFDLIVPGSDNIGRVNQGVYMGTVGETQGDGESGPWPARCCAAAAVLLAAILRLIMTEHEEE